MFKPRKHHHNPNNTRFVPLLKRKAVSPLQDKPDDENKENVQPKKQRTTLELSIWSSVPAAASKPERIFQKGQIVNTRFRICEDIGTGSFGEVYRVIDLKDGREFALKVEKPNGTRNNCAFLQTEFSVYRIVDGAVGIPVLRYFGVDKVTKSPIIVMDLLGPSLEDLRIKCGGKFSRQTVMMLADQMIERVEFLHTKNYIHRDLKPENFLIGRQKENLNPYYYGKKTSGDELYLIDYGLAKKYRDKHLQHIACAQYGGVTGTVRYTSIHSHLGQELSRRDDLESIGYVIVYFLKGRLPWQGLHGTTRKEKHGKIADYKMKCSLQELCSGLPSQVGKFIESCRRLTFEEVPDYTFLRSLFRMQINDYKLSKGEELVYDWNKLNCTSTPTAKLTGHNHNRHIK